MSKRFGRNKKRTLQKHIDELKVENNLLRKRTPTPQMKQIHNESMSIACMPNYMGMEDAGILRIQIDPLPLMFGRSYRLRDLQVWKRFPQNLASELSKTFETELIKTIPHLLHNVPET